MSARAKSKWQSLDTAPTGERVLVWGAGGIQFARLDELGNWRAGAGNIIRVPPRLWQPMPETPTEEERSR